MAVKIVRIFQLTGVANSTTELPGALFEIEALTGPVAGGYTNKKLTAEQLVEYLAPLVASTGPTVQQVFALLEEGTGIDLSLTPGGRILVSCTVQAPAPAPTAPAAPTEGQVDDAADTFSFLPTAPYLSFAQHKVAGLPGVTGAVYLDATNSYVQGNRIYIKVVGAVAKGGLAVYVAGSGNIPDGQVLTNSEPFTSSGAVVTPPTTTALGVAFTIGGATLTPGQSLSFSATASGGTAPYTHAVHAEEVTTGAVTSIGSATTPGYAGIWQAVPAGTYDLTDTVSDAAGASKVSSTRRVVVSPATTTPPTPLTYANNLSDGQVALAVSNTTDGTGYVHRFNAFAANNNVGFPAMLVFIGGVQVATVEFPPAALGQPCAGSYGGQTYTTANGAAYTFIDGSVNLS